MSEYEFKAAEDAQVDALRTKLLHICVLFLVLGVMFVVQAHVYLLGTSRLALSIGGALFVLLAIVFWRPLDNFRRVTTTQGDDIPQFMMAMDDLRVAFTTSQIVIGLLILTEVIGIGRLLTA